MRYPEPDRFHMRKMAKARSSLRDITFNDYYGGSMPSGWVDGMLEQCPFWLSSLVFPRRSMKEICHANKNMMSIRIIGPRHSWTYWQRGRYEDITSQSRRRLYENITICRLFSTREWIGTTKVEKKFLSKVGQVLTPLVPLQFCFII